MPNFQFLVWTGEGTLCVSIFYYLNFGEIYERFPTFLHTVILNTISSVAIILIFWRAKRRGRNVLFLNVTVFGVFE